MSFRSVFLVVAVSASLIGVAPNADAAPAASFEWSMPERFADGDEDGTLDYFSDITSEPDRRAFVAPEQWDVALNACGSTAGADEYRWAVNGRPVNPTPSPSIACLFSYPFPYEGAFDVALTVVDGGVESPPIHQRVVVQDWLIVALGDSYASGEGAPDDEGPVDGPTWKDARCDRSANAGAAVAARELEEADPKTSVTFVHLACSGATIMSGLLGPYEGTHPPAALTPSPKVPFPCVTGKNDKGKWIELKTHPSCLPPQIDRAQELIQDRELDALHLSIGGNDAHFASIVKACMLEDDCNTDPFDVLAIPELEGLKTICDEVFTVAGEAKDACNEFIDDLIDLRAALRANDRNAQDLIDQGVTGRRTPVDPPLIFQGLRPLFDKLDAELNDKLLNGGAWRDRVFQTEYVDATTSFDGSYCDWDPSQHFDGHPPFVNESESEWVDGSVERRINSVIGQNAQRYGWTVVDNIHKSFQRHGLCSKKRYLRTLGESLLYQHDPSGAVHPNVDGYRVIGKRLLESVRQSLYGPCTGAPVPGAKVLEGWFTSDVSDHQEAPGFSQESYELTVGEVCIADPTGPLRADNGRSKWEVTYRELQRFIMSTCSNINDWRADDSGGYIALTSEDPSSANILYREHRGNASNPDSYRIFPHEYFQGRIHRSTTCAGDPDPEDHDFERSANTTCEGDEGWATVFRETSDRRWFQFSCRTLSTPTSTSLMTGELIEWKDPPAEPKPREPLELPEQICAAGPTGAANEKVGGPGNDDLQGTGGEDVIFGLAGNDKIRALGGDDILCGGDGSDGLLGGGGNDGIAGEDGDDTLSGQGGADRLSGGEGPDTLSGGPEDDHLLGNGGDDVLAGDEGRNILRGGEGADEVSGGDDEDMVFGAGGADLIDGKRGVDELFGGDGDDRMFGAAGSDLAWGDAGADLVLGEDGGDVLAGGDGPDDLRGGGGVDQLAGDAGNDTLDGGGGLDLLDGGTDVDICTEDAADPPAQDCEV